VLYAPKGLWDSARVSTPGTAEPRKCALKGRQNEHGENTRALCKNLWPLQGESFCLMVPGLKPWAEFYSPFGAIKQPKYSLS
jgi:hypothetical protein